MVIDTQNKENDITPRKSDQFVDKNQNMQLEIKNVETPPR